MIKVKNVKVLDCTLRDGGRLFNCEFSDYEIREINKRLSRSNIDIIEVGFLRDAKKVQYKGNSTFFTDVTQIEPFIPSNNSSLFVAFIDYGMFDFDTLPPCNGNSVTGLRIGFTKKDFDNHYEDVVSKLKEVKSKKYKLFVQGVNSLAYSDEELIRLIDMINDIDPYSFGIVDTYGAMYPDDFERIFNIVNARLNKGIMLDFHAHNNRQMAFALAQQCIRMCGDTRHVIVDATLEGMGKCAGNLNLELIVDYLNTKKAYNYDFDEILDTIDEFIVPVKKDYSWGYSIPALVGGIYKSHPNNIIYLFNKFRMECKDFKNIISMIDPDTRQRYDYDNLEDEYSDTKIDDSKDMIYLRELFENKKILVKSPGHSLIDYKDKIEKYQKENSPIVITVSFSEPGSICFCTNKRRFDKLLIEPCSDIILTSNVTSKTNDAYLINYNSVIDRRYPLFDNSVMMLLNLLRKMHIKSIAIAGFDGYDEKMSNYIDDSFPNKRQEKDYQYLNEQISIMIDDYVKSMEPQVPIEFITPTKYVRGN